MLTPGYLLILQVLAEQVIQRIVHVNNFKSKLITARRKLTGMGDEENTSSRSKGDLIEFADFLLMSQYLCVS